MTGMTRILLAGALAASALFLAPAAHACTPAACLESLCERAGEPYDCQHPVCFETPEIAYCP